ncbi:MAG: beta-N-acetylhexosaminidase [Clostridia bacterium]|jgi:hexosaminidase
MPPIRNTPPDGGLVPRPRVFEYCPDTFHPKLPFGISADPPFAAEAAWAAEALSTAFTLPVTLVEDRKAAIRVRYVADPEQEGYRLALRPSGARITASSAAGAFYGLQTLRALALIWDGRIPCCIIEDAPRFGWRGFMLDTVRNFFEPAFIKRLIDLAALHKLNRFHWHLTDDQGWRLPIPGRPELVQNSARKVDRRYVPPLERTLYYDEDAIRDILSYAAERHVTVIPEIEMPGHVLALLSSHPEFSCTGSRFEPEDRFGIYADVLCAGNDDVFMFLEEVMDEVVRLFPGLYVHFGGDEVPTERWALCPRCRKRMADEGLPDAAALQGWFTRQAAGILRRRGRRPVGWDEIVQSATPKDAIVMAWRSAERGREAAEAGHDVVMCPGSRACYLDHKHRDVPDEPGHLGVSTVKDSYLFDPLENLSENQKSRILGMQGNLWTEIMYFGRHVEYMAFPRLSALAETAWTPGELRSFDGFSARLRWWGKALDSLDVARYRGPLE